jgi:outer membrane protein TolC
VQRALNEVEGALSAAVAADDREAILARSVASNARSVELARVRFNVGSGDLRTVLQQNVALYGARTSLLNAQSERLVQRVNLYLALGGSFETAPSAPVTPTGDNGDSSLASAGAARAASN